MNCLPVRLVARRAKVRVHAMAGGVEWRVWDGEQVKVLRSYKLERQSATHASLGYDKAHQLAFDWLRSQFGRSRLHVCAGATVYLCRKRQHLTYSSRSHDRTPNNVFYHMFCTTEGRELDSKL